MRLLFMLSFMWFTLENASAGTMSPSIADENTNYRPILVEFGYDPCRDGRFSDGRPHTCDEIRRLWRRQEQGRERPLTRHMVHPCFDGRVSEGRPRTCREILDWMRRDSDLERPWHDAPRRQRR
jgi:hypothetical protein